MMEDSSKPSPVSCGTEDSDTCQCECHRGGLIHFTACCHGCPYCKARIIMGRMRHYVETCHVKTVHLTAQAEEASK